MIIAPSLLAANYLNLEKDLEVLNKSQAKWLHYDVMDGHFVNNFSFGPGILQAIQTKTDLVLDVHLMVIDPLRIANYFLQCKPDYLTIHFEATDNLQAFVDLCRENDVKPGVSIKPDTDVKVLDQIAAMFDLILVMSVEPGFGNQKFMPEALDKISYLKQRPHKYLIEVDGGINKETALLCKEAGADVLVAGGYVFSGDIIERVKSLL